MVWGEVLKAVPLRMTQVGRGNESLHRKPKSLLVNFVEGGAWTS